MIPREQEQIKPFLSGVVKGVEVRPLRKHQDNRGWLIELFRSDELSERLIPAMAYISETLPGVTRGPHEHVEQIDYFCFLGPSTFELYLWDNRPGSATYWTRQIVLAGEQTPSMVIVPERVVHAYRNIGSQAGWVINCPNRLYAGKGRKEAVDEIRHEDEAGSPFRLDDLK
jgi:dTDP-4-dehydrorhamnose 3,5-epimerase